MHPGILSAGIENRGLWLWPSRLFWPFWLRILGKSAPSHYLNQWWLIINQTLRNTLQWNLNKNTQFFIHENSLENVVCEMAAILSRGRWVKHLLWLLISCCKIEFVGWLLWHGLQLLFTMLYIFGLYIHGKKRNCLQMSGLWGSVLLTHWALRNVM